MKQKRFEMNIMYIHMSEAIKSERRIVRKLKKLKDRKICGPLQMRGDQPYTPAKFKRGIDPQAYTNWGNKLVLRLQEDIRYDSSEARLFHLARMFLKGTPYEVVEQKNNDGNQLNEFAWETVQFYAKEYAEFDPNVTTIEQARELGAWANEQQLSQAFEEWKSGRILQ